MSLTSEHIKILSAPFDEKTLGVKVNNFSKDRTKAMLVPYIQHTDAYIRIEQVDPSWSSEVMDVREAKDSVFIRVKMTILGVSRDNWGEGQDYKSAASDAIKRAAMLFGVGRYLYDAENVWVPYNENEDRFRVWTYSDYKNGLRKGQAQLPVGPATVNTVAPKPLDKKVRTSKDAIDDIKQISGLLGISEKEMYEWAQEVSGKPAAKMTSVELEKFLAVLQEEAGRKGVAVS